MVDVSIIIVNWNTRDFLYKCLEGIFETINELEFEVFVVDNTSSDDSVAMLREHFQQVTVIENRENVGFACANNQAIKVANGRYILLLNADTFLHDGAVETLAAHMDTHPDTGVAGCRLYYEDGRLQRSCSSFPTITTELWQLLWLDRLFPNTRIFGKYLMTYWDLDDLRDVDSVLGACMMIRHQALEEIGDFDERFFMYSEEVDFCYRLKRAGWKVCYVPSASATHIWGGSSRKVQPAMSLLRLYKSRFLFFHKHYGKYSAAIYKWILVLKSLSRVVLGLPARLLLKDQVALDKSRGYWKLLRELPAF